MIQLLRELLHREPFQPFRIVTTSGDKYDVTLPDLVAIGESMLFCFHPKSDRFAHIRLNQVVAVESLQTAK